MKRALLLPAALLLAAAGDASPLLLREQAWTAEARAQADAVMAAPGECLARRTPQIEAGRALFRNPLLLGGPAARAGLSCDACHSNGRVNAAFLLPELTDRAGAADVTSEWSSRVRGDGVMNPVAIPDLVGAGARAHFGQAREPSLERFVRNVVVEEFQGGEPAQATVAAIAAYLRALDARACPAKPQAVSLRAYAEDVRRALAAAAAADAATAGLVVAAAQDRMGRIAERLPRSGFAAERRTLAALSAELTPLRADSAAFAASLPGWRVRFDAAIARLEARERDTYFNGAVLAAAL